MKQLQKKQSDESIFLMAEFKSEYFETPEYLENKRKLNASKSVEESQALLHESHTFSKQFHEEMNRKNFSLLKSFNYTDYTFIGYAPFIRLEMSRKELNPKTLLDFVKNNKVVNVSIYYEPVAVDSETASWVDTLKAIKAYSTIHSSLYTGRFSKVGIFEASGICDPTISNLSGKDITVDSTCTTISDHANKVTSIAALIAPEASYFVSNNSSYGGLSWFIDNDCTVVNCSFAYTDTYLISDNTYSFLNTGYRYFIDGLYDYQIRANHISCVVASGNVYQNMTEPNYNPDGYVLSPGLAYNAITVGGVERKHYYYPHI